jgi:hypothetical protein
MIDMEQATRTLWVLEGKYERVPVSYERAQEIVVLSEVLELTYKSNSLHVWEERYLISGKLYSILQLCGSNSAAEVNELITRNLS